MKSTVFVLLALCLSIGVLVWGGWSAAAAWSERDEAADARAAAELQAAELARLAALPASAAVGAPQVDGSVLVSTTLTQSGLSGSVLRDVIAEGDVAVGSGYMRRGFRVTLDPVEPAQLGRFLSAWKKSQPLWTVSRIDLSRVASPMDRSTAYRASLSMACVFVKDERR